jgi:hypothetical protein
MVRAFVLGAGMLAAVMLGGVACSMMPGEVGSGRVITETRSVGQFNEVHMASFGVLIIKQGEAEALVVEAEDNILPKIKTEVAQGRLVIGTHDDSVEAIRPTKPVTYRLTVKNLNGVELTGVGSVEATNIRTDRLKVALSGAGNAKIDGLSASELGTTISGVGSFSGSGTVSRQEVRISGAGGYEAKNLQAATATVTVSGTGGATVHVTDTLNVQISGVGGATYLGSPKVNQQVSGLGSVNKGS